MTYASYDSFRLKARMTVSGTVGVGFGYDGILEPDAPRSDAEPGKRALASCVLLEMTAASPEESASWRLVQLKPDGEALVFDQGKLAVRHPEQPFLLDMERKEGILYLALDDQEPHPVKIPDVKSGPLVLTAEPFSMMTCSKFEVSGEARPWIMTFGAKEALLGAGQSLSDWTPLPGGQFAGSGSAAAKWNVTGNRFTVWAPKGPEYGVMAVSLDGVLLGTVPLQAKAPCPSAPVFSTGEVAFGSHSITLTPWEGTIVADLLEVEGPAVL